MTLRMRKCGSDRGRRVGTALGLAALVLFASLTGLAGPVQAQQEQDEIDEPAPAARIPPMPSAAGAELNAALSRLAREPRNVSALVDAGQAALRLGDTQAALGFFTRADQVSPNNAKIKMQIGSALVLANEPTDAVKYFDAAESANGDLTAFALDRGLAYDLLGDNRQAQGWYQVALSRGPNEEATLRYAISLAISHDLKTAETLLAPMIQKQDRAAWRARTFALAINGDETQAVSISRAMMPAQLAEGIAPYLRYMPRLTRPQQAAAANLGRFPRAADIGHDDSRIMAYAAAHPEIGRSLVPAGAPLGALASNDDARTSRAKRRRPGQDDSSSRPASARPATAASPIDGDLTTADSAPAAKPVKDRSKERGKPVDKSPALARPAIASLSPQVTAPPPPPPAVPTPTVLSVLDKPPVRGSTPQRTTPAPSLAQVVPVKPALAPPAVAKPDVVKPVVAKVVPAPPPSAPLASARVATSGASVVKAPAISAPLATAPKPEVAASVPVLRPALTASAGASAAPPSAVVTAMPPPPSVPASGTGSAPSIATVAPPPSTAAPTGDANASAASRPAMATNFDLARLDSSRPPASSLAPAPVPPTKAAEAPVPATPQSALVPSASPPPSPSPASSVASATAKPAPAASDFGSAFGSFTPPPTERESAVAAVDLSKIKPVRRRPGKAAEPAPVVEEPAPNTLKGKAALKARLKARGERPDGPAASRSEDEEPVTVTRGAKLGPKARKAALEAEAAAATKKGGKGKRGAPANPSRIWVQLLTAPNRNAFPREWARIAKQAPAILRGKRGWVTPWGRNYRLLVGPYASDDDAQDALNDLTKAKVRGFIWTSPAGQAVDHLGDEG